MRIKRQFIARGQTIRFNDVYVSLTKNLQIAGAHLTFIEDDT